MKNYHILHEGNGWAIKSEGRARAMSTHATKAEAITAARKLLTHSHQSDLVIHGRDGRILGEYPHATRTGSGAKKAGSSRRGILDLQPLSLGAVLQPLNSRADLEDALWPGNGE
jgi:hypothetical protein